MDKTLFLLLGYELTYDFNSYNATVLVSNQLATTIESTEFE